MNWVGVPRKVGEAADVFVQLEKEYVGEGEYGLFKSTSFYNNWNRKLAIEKFLKTSQIMTIQIIIGVRSNRDKLLNGLMLRHSSSHLVRELYILAKIYSLRLLTKTLYLIT